MTKERRREAARSIDVLIDEDATEDDVKYRSAASLLNHLYPGDLVDFRSEVRQRYNDGRPRFRCFKCNAPVYVSAGTHSSPDRDGRHAFFAHHKGYSEDCEWGDYGQVPDDINREKFQGAQEGQLHFKLKKVLAEILTLDPDFADVRTEAVIVREQGYRKPDVSARMSGQQFAFDLQLATTQLPTILDREGFYRSNDISYMWLTSVSDTHRLRFQAFQDIFWRNHAQIFGVDEEALAETKRRSTLHLWNLSIHPVLDNRQLEFVWKKTLVAKDEIQWRPKGLKPVCSQLGFEEALDQMVKFHFGDSRKRLINAVKDPDRDDDDDDIGIFWNTLAKQVDGIPYQAARHDHVRRAIGVLASAASGSKRDYTNFLPDQLPALFNQFLEERSYRGWTSALVAVADAYGHQALLGTPSTVKKITRNLGENHEDKFKKHKSVMDVLFPKQALSKLTEIPIKLHT